MICRLVLATLAFICTSATSSGENPATFRAGIAYCKDFDISPDGRFLAITGFSLVGQPEDAGIGHLVVFDLATKREVLRFTVDDGFPLSTRFSPDAKFLASVGTSPFNNARIWSTKDWTVLKDLPHSSHYVEVLEFSHDSQWLLTNDDTDDLRLLLVRWDFGEDSPASKRIFLQAATLQSVAIAPDGKCVAVVDTRGVITFRNASLDKVESAITIQDAREVIFSPNGKQACCITRKASVHIIDVGEKQICGRLDVSDEVFCAAWWSDTELLLGTRNGAVELWDVQKKQSLTRTQVHMAPVVRITRIPGDASHVLSLSTHGVRKSSLKDP